jgi:hypothetical protein
MEDWLRFLAIGVFALRQPYCFDLKLVRVPTARYPDFLVNNVRPPDHHPAYKLLMYVETRQGQTTG